DRPVSEDRSRNPAPAALCTGPDPRCGRRRRSRPGLPCSRACQTAPVEGRDLRAWLFTILHNQYVNQVRRSVREGAAVAVSETEPSLTHAADQGKRLELRDLDRALARLPEEQRVVILLVGLEGMRYEAVAEVIGVPVGTVRSRLSRGREALRRLMGIVADRQAEAIMAHAGAGRHAGIEHRRPAGRAT